MPNKNGDVRYATIALVAILIAIVCVCLVGLGQRYIEIHYGMTEGAQAPQGVGASTSNADFDPLNDTLTQWVMALCALLACATSIWGIVILRETLEQGRAASVAATRATEAAIESNAIMRADQRPWISLSILPVAIEFRPESNSLMLKIQVKMNNKGRSPAIDLAMYGSVKIIPKDQRDGLDSADYVDLRTKVITEAVKQTKRRTSFTEVVFQDETSTIPGFGIHAHISHFTGISETDDIALVAAFALAYSHGDKYGGAIWSALISPAFSREIFGFSIGAIKANQTLVQSVSLAPVTYF